MWWFYSNINISHQFTYCDFQLSKKRPGRCPGKLAPSLMANCPPLKLLSAKRGKLQATILLPLETRKVGRATPEILFVAKAPSRLIQLLLDRSNFAKVDLLSCLDFYWHLLPSKYGWTKQWKHCGLRNWNSLLSSHFYSWIAFNPNRDLGCTMKRKPAATW